MRVVMAAAEMAPFAKTGGLADVMAALPGALRRQGVDVAVVMPGYPAAIAATGAKPTFTSLSVPVSTWRIGGALLRGALADGTPVYLIEHEYYFARAGLYGTASGDYGDNGERFTFFARAVLAALETIGSPDLLHCHDWHAGLVPAFLRADGARYPQLRDTRTVITIHNLGYQGLFPPAAWHLLQLDPSLFSPEYLEFYGQINFLKAGVVFADGINTVSQRYAQEIQTPEHGFGLDGLLRARHDDLVGILNGVDYGEWSPQTDSFLAAKYSSEDLRGKRRCKLALQAELGLPQSAAIPLVGVVSRLAEQKGADLISAAIPGLAERGIQLAILGSGDLRMEGTLRDLSGRFPDTCSVRIGFDNGLAHRIEAGTDLFLMPSRYEPCGLNQIYSLRYGTIPVVRATGGLDDTVDDFDPETGAGTGFKFGPYALEAMLGAFDRALGVYRRPRTWRRVMRAAMQKDFSWDRSADRYAAWYRRIAPGNGDRGLSEPR